MFANAEAKFKSNIEVLTLIELEEPGDYPDEFERDEKVWLRRPPRSPATTKKIAECEQLLGRAFSPSYRGFLLKHNGWEKCQLLYDIFGVVDHQSLELRKRLGGLMRGFLQGCEAPIQGVSDEEFLPENLYRLADSHTPVVSHLQPLKAFLDAFEEADDWICLPKHTIIGADFANGELILLDRNIEQGKDEANILRERYSAVASRHDSFDDWLSYLAEWKIYRSE